MADSNGKTLIEDLSNWVITCEVQVDSRKATITSDMTDDAKEQVKKENAWIDKFDVAGDYSAERMYAKLSSMSQLISYLSYYPSTDQLVLGIDWTKPQSDYTICGLDKDGKPVSYKNWYAADPDRAMYLNLWLMSWSHKQDEQGRNNIGLSIQIPPGKIK